MLLRHLARPMLATWFIHSGYSAVRHPDEHLEPARHGLALAGAAPRRLAPDASAAFEPEDARLKSLIRAQGVATIVAGACFGLGKAPRLAAFTLAALTAPLAVANEPFSHSDIPREERMPRFVANIGAIGAVLIAGADLEGRPGVRWRIDRARAQAAAAKQADGQEAGTRRKPLHARCAAHCRASGHAAGHHAAGHHAAHRRAALRATARSAEEKAARSAEEKRDA